MEDAGGIDDLRLTIDELVSVPVLAEPWCWQCRRPMLPADVKQAAKRERAQQNLRAIVGGKAVRERASAADSHGGPARQSSIVNRQSQIPRSKISKLCTQ